MRFYTMLPALALIALSACEPGIASYDDQGRAFATLEHYGDKISIQAPREVQRGQDFVVTVAAYGGGCITKGETELEKGAWQATITPYEYDSSRVPPSYPCTAELRVFEHLATISFDSAGTTEIVVKGKRKPSGERVIVRRTITVR